MAISEKVQIKCDDEEMMKILTKEYKDEIFDLKISDGFIHIQNIEYATDKDLLKITGTNKNILVSAKFLFKKRNHQAYYVFNYLNGTKYLYNIENKYEVLGIKNIEKLNVSKEIREEVINTVIDFYKKIDTVERDELGFFTIEDNTDKTIILNMEICGFYYVEALKIGSVINILDFSHKEQI